MTRLMVLLRDERTAIMLHMKSEGKPTAVWSTIIGAASEVQHEDVALPFGGESGVTNGVTISSC